MFATFKYSSSLLRCTRLQAFGRSTHSIPFPRSAPKTKIVCTMGPASEPKLDDLVQAGMDVARLNFSHSTHDYHKSLVKKLRDLSAKYNNQIGILCDIQGPKIRVGDVKEPFVVSIGDTIAVTSNKIVGTPEKITIDYPPLMEELDVGSKIFINDGIVQLTVTNKLSDSLTCRVDAAGIISSQKGCNIAGCNLSIDVISEKDKRDLKLIAELDPEYVAASFVGNANDVHRVRETLAMNGNKNIKIVSKIERAVALHNIDEIIQASDAIMVARGDLGVEIPPQDVPVAQKMIVKKCNQKGLPVIVATQMLESMILQARPTRAEANDVFNAVVDGTDAVMLSGETSMGKYPVGAVKVMDDIVARAENCMPPRHPNDFDSKIKSNMVVESIGHIVHDLVNEIHSFGHSAKIIVITKSGYTARMISKYRPNAHMIVQTPELRATRELSLVWGVTPVYRPELRTMEKDLEARAFSAIKQSLRDGLVHQNDHVIVIGSSIVDPAVGISMELYDISKIMNKLQ